GPPLQPGAPDATPTIGARDGFLDVRWDWSSSQDNGDPVRNFRVTSYKAGAQESQVVVGAGERVQNFTTENGVQYQFTIEAENKAGWSPPSPMSAAAMSAGPPLGTLGVQASEGDTQSVLTVTGSVDDNGSPIERQEY